MNLKNLLLYTGTFCALFITTTTAPFLGIESVGFFAYIYFILLFTFYCLVHYRTIKLTHFKAEFISLIVFLLYGICQYFNNGLAVIQQAFNFILVPMMIHFVMKLQNESSRKGVGIIVLSFYFLECFLAIYERISGINVFPYKNEVENPFIEVFVWQFRSTAFLGHPLNNALCTSTILGFILISRLQVWIKYISLGLGIYALLSFNARGATLVMGFIALYFFMHQYKVNLKSSISKIFFMIIVCSTLWITTKILTETSIGGRIFNEKSILDGSAKTRLLVFNAFEFINGTDWLIGNPTLYIPITRKLGAAGIENSYIVMIIEYGLMFGIPIILLYINLVLKSIKNYSLNQKLIIVCSFLLIGSMNNSLSGNTPWVIFILCMSSIPYLKNEYIDSVT